jgi:hypothetical protein
MSEYDTSAYSPTENVKTPSPYVVRSSEREKPQPNKTAGRKPGRNTSSESVELM